MPPKTTDAAILEREAELARWRALLFRGERQRLRQLLELPPYAETWYDIGEEVQCELQDLYAGQAKQARIQEIRARFRNNIPEGRRSWP